jgi:Mrp family chromosome partitioning ATPase
MSRVEKALKRAADRPLESSPPELADGVAAEIPARAPSDRAPLRSRLPQSRPAEFSSAKTPLLAFPDAAAAEAAQADVISPELVRPDSRLVTASDASPLGVERYRELAEALQDMQERSVWGGPDAKARSFKSLLVTSAGPREGKTLTAVNLALTFTEALDKQVLLVDGHVNRPGVHRLLNIASADVLAAVPRSASDGLPPRQVSSRLWVLPAGHAADDSGNALKSERMRAVLADAVSRFDWVLIDGPAANVGDAQALAEFVRAALLVIRSGVTPYRDVERAIAALGRGCIVGTVLNRAAHA